MMPTCMQGRGGFDSWWNTLLPFPHLHVPFKIGKPTSGQGDGKQLGEYSLEKVLLQFPMVAALTSHENVGSVLYN